MNRTDTTGRLPRELAYRASDGFEVWLLWTKLDNRVFVLVYDASRETSFELDVEPENALDAFDHPLAYAAFRGIEPAAAPARNDSLVPGA